MVDSDLFESKAERICCGLQTSNKISSQENTMSKDFMLAWLMSKANSEILLTIQFLKGQSFGEGISLPYLPSCADFLLIGWW